MQEPASSETWSVESARNAVLQWTLRLVAVCGLLWWISAAVTTPVFPRSLYGTVSLVLLMIVWIAAVTPRINARWQLCAILLFCSVVNLLALVCVGLSPNNAILVFLMVLVVSLYWGIRAGWAASGAIALMIAASAFGWHRGFFPLPGFASSLDFTLWGNWVRMGVVTVFGALGAALVVDVFVRQLRAAVNDMSKTMERMRESETRYRVLFEQAGDHVLVLELRDGAVPVVIDANEAALQAYGYRHPELVGQPISVLEPGGTLGRHAERLRRLQGEATSLFEIRHRRKDGTEFDVEVKSQLADLGGKRIIISVERDISDRKRLEAQLLHLQKMEAVGQLAGGVAHDFNNILAAFMMNLGLLQMDPALSPGVRAALAELEEGARRAANLTRQLLMFSRRQILQVRQIDLDEVLADLLQMLRRLIGENIHLVFAGSGAPHWIEADTGMIEQVITNLCVNARDAMSEGGTLTLTTGEMVVDEIRTNTNPEAHAGRLVTLTVTDTGCGMDAATAKRIFEPFFTTKEVGKGTGLGLATVYGIVTQHRGWIEVRSAVGQGSSFEIFLPASSAPRSKEHPAAPPQIAGGHETILLVEDEAPVRHTFRIGLQRLGYRVLEAETGIQALELWEQHRGRIDLLFTDMIMPEGMTGLQLAERLRAKDPALKVIIASGYGSRAAGTLSPDAKSAGIRYLAKPFEIMTLAATVRTSLDEKD